LVRAGRLDRNPPWISFAFCDCSGLSPRTCGNSITLGNVCFCAQFRHLSHFPAFITFFLVLYCWFCSGQTSVSFFLGCQSSLYLRFFSSCVQFPCGIPCHKSHPNLGGSSTPSREQDALHHLSLSPAEGRLSADRMHAIDAMLLVITPPLCIFFPSQFSFIGALPCRPKSPTPKPFGPEFLLSPRFELDQY